ncbi:MalY/PatB family protein [Tomitella fengzijianii]|uniref:MalY/PatB family protein n=1 Tax=Tomitella fengzijianii TaxID=2597660 RepID=UPI00131C4F29|nr:aminotransferase class I/II-fold pyridoxal phosphate-dependent enzyme [Tomitella fengzijianii]
MSVVHDEQERARVNGAATVVGRTPDFGAVTVPRLRAAGSMKWTKYPGTLAAFVAEMDFGVAEPVADAIDRVVRRGVLGYTPAWMEDALKNATSEMYARRYGWRPEPAAVFPVADVIRAYEFAITHLSPPGGKLVLLTPAYGPFFAVAGLTGRQVIEVPMLREGDEWLIDFPAVDAAFADGGGLLVLCNPHNPVGKVYTREEQAALAAIVERHGGTVFSDEVHAPFVFAGAQHVPYASMGGYAAEHCVTATSASKAFNIPGLKCAQLIAGGERQRAILDGLGVFVTHGASVTGVAANIAAYERGDEWLGSVMGYLDGNRQELLDAVGRALPAARIARPEATYFGWIDLGPAAPDGDVQRFLIDNAEVAISSGASFGVGCDGHIRFNFATRRQLIPQAVNAIAAALAHA